MFLINKFKFLLYGFLFAENGEGGFYIYNFIFIIQRGGDFEFLYYVMFQKGDFIFKFYFHISEEGRHIKIVFFWPGIRKTKGYKI